MSQMHRVIKENIFINAFKHPKCEGNKLILRKKMVYVKKQNLQGQSTYIMKQHLLIIIVYTDCKSIFQKYMLF